MHNYLIDYRFEHSNHNPIDISDTQLFNDIISTSCAEPLQVGNDLGRPKGCLNNLDRSSHNFGMLIRDKLTTALHEHNLHRPQRKEWKEDINTHVQRI